MQGRDNVTFTANGSANCAGNRSECKNTAEKGAVVLSHKQSYSGYAVIRETYGSATAPSNSYVALIDTPTTDRKTVVDATYKGQASYSNKFNPTVASRADFTLTVSGDSVSGIINNASTGTGVVYPLVTLKDGTINATTAGVTFSGEADFAARTFNGSAKNPDLAGTYRGAFAGANAEEVVGVFETNSTDKDTSVQGAFAGTRQ